MIDRDAFIKLSIIVLFLAAVFTGSYYLGQHNRTVYAYSVGQKVNLHGMSGIITYRNDERLVGVFIFPIVDDSPYYRVSYRDMNGVIRSEVFTETELKLINSTQ